MISFQQFITSVILLGLGSILGAYLNGKGQNRAAKEDAGGITRETELARSPFAREIEDRKATHEMRHACIKERFRAHQEAFTRWIHIVRSTHVNLGEYCAECEDWWVKNCLYLEKNASRAFFSAFRLAPGQDRLLKINEFDMHEKNAKTINEAGGVIAQAVGLPAISEVLPPKSAPTGSQP